MDSERLRTRLIRLWKMEELLLTHPAGYTALELSRHFQVDRRTIYRDLALLEELGVPLVKGDDFRAPYRILGTYTRPSYRASLTPA